MGLFKKIKDKIANLMIKLDNGFLCDTCRYNHPNTCSVPGRPNMKSCDEYSRK